MELAPQEKPRLDSQAKQQSIQMHQHLQGKWTRATLIMPPSGPEKRDRSIT